MLQPAQHHQWLHTSFIVSKNSQKSDAIGATEGSNLRGRRVWSKRDLSETASGLVTVSANTGGTVAFHDQAGDLVVRWDNGHISMHHKDTLLRQAFLIGAHRTLQSFCDCLSNRK
ncbi:MAG: hypothetical protein JSS83_13060 [Cyanobacteria bacterium SZAS LIN-3]|nr:hypothetical protein [Cyanobacteria bacterium SZAS LIN-3]